MTRAHYVGAMTPRTAVTTLVVGLFLVLAPGAHAAITLDYDATADQILISGDGNNATFVGFSNTFVPQGAVTVRNSTGVTNNAAECLQEDTPVIGTYFHCPAAATAVIAQYGAGQDSLTLEGVCGLAVAANLGDGPGEFYSEYSGNCAGAPEPNATYVVGGSAQDTFVGGVGPDEFLGGGGNDTLRTLGGDDILRGGPDNDTLEAGDGNDQALGEDGNDAIAGGFGNDLEDGAAGDDTIGSNDNDQGTDDVRGGPGVDTLDLSGHAGGMTITLDDGANDGAPGENDNLHADFERVFGTGGADTYTGTAGPDYFRGGTGADVARGGAGNDEIDGDSDADQIFGDEGTDTLYGGYGDDRVEGGAGPDSLFGDYSACSAYGCSAGNDQMFARDGEADAVNCGSGADTAQVDAVDVVGSDGFQLCETVDRAAPGAGPGATPGPGSTPGTTTTPSLATSGTPSTSKGVRLSVSCPGPCTISAKLVISAKLARRYGLGRKIATIGVLGRRSLLAAGTDKRTLKLSKKARTKLRRARTVTATLQVTVRDAAGKTRTLRKTVKLKR